MERALLNLRAARSTDPPRSGIDFVVEFMAPASSAARRNAIACACRVCGRCTTAKSVGRFHGSVVRGYDARGTWANGLWHLFGSRRNTLTSSLVSEPLKTSHQFEPVGSAGPTVFTVEPNKCPKPSRFTLVHFLSAKMSRIRAALKAPSREMWQSPRHSFLPYSQETGGARRRN